MTNVGGWLFTVVALGIFYAFWRNSSQSIGVLVAGLIAIFSHQLLSVANVLYGPFSFTAFDAASFHLHAVQRVEMPETKVWSLGSDIYKSLLASVYSIFGVSVWLGQAFSIVFFAISSVVFVRFSKTLRLSSSSIEIGLLLFGLLPSSLMFGSLTLRETFMTLFFMWGVYAAFLAIHDDDRSRQWKLYLWAVVAFFMMGIFHMILLVYALLVCALLFLILYAQRAPIKKTLIQSLVCVVAVGVVLLLIKEMLPVNLADNYFAMLRIQVAGEVVPIPHAVSIYHQTANATGANTQYDAALEFTTWGRMFYVFFYSYAFYLGWPVTGDYTQLSTWVLMAEALFRLLGIALMLLMAKHNKQWYWLVMVYVSLTFLWNIGTSNHGQALRHHMMTEWILILALLSFAQQRLSLFSRQKS